MGKFWLKFCLLTVLGEVVGTEPDANVVASLRSYRGAMRRAELLARLGADRHAVLAVVHVIDSVQAERNAQLALSGGAHGVLLINHDFSTERFLPIVRYVRAKLPDAAWLGVNFLGVPLRAAAVMLGELHREGVRVDGYWADDAQIDEYSDGEGQAMAKFAREAREKSGWQGLYFGGVCFKKQRPVHPARRSDAARLAIPYMDCITTSGSATGEPAEVQQVADMRCGCGDAALAIGSGITPENVTAYMPLADVFIVATGISEPGAFHELSATRLAALVRALAVAPAAATAPLQAPATSQRLTPYLPLMGPNTRGFDGFPWIDPSRMYTHASAFATLVEELLSPFAPQDVDLIAGIDAMGFPLAAAMALKWGKGLLTIRKAGKLCCDVDGVDYGGTVYGRPGRLEMRKPAFAPGIRVIIADQWIETGNTMTGAITLIERQGGIVVGFTAVNVQDNERTVELRRRYKFSCAGSFGEELQEILLPHYESPAIVSGAVQLRSAL